MPFGIHSRGRQGRTADKTQRDAVIQKTHMHTHAHTDAHKHCINSRESYPVISLLMESALMTWM